MTESVLKAQMQLFAIVARLEAYSDEFQQLKKQIEYLDSVRNFIEHEIAPSQIDMYLNTFIEYYELLGKRKKFSNFEEQTNSKRTSLNSVKALRICDEINRELNFRQKFYAYIRINELIALQDNITDSTMDFLSTLTDSFHLDKTDAALIQKFILNPLLEEDLPKNILIGTNERNNKASYLYVRDLKGKVFFGYLHSVNIVIARYFGPDPLTLNSNTVDASKTILMQSGAFIQCGPTPKLYQSDILNRFLKLKIKEKIVFKANNITFKSKFTNKTIIQPITSTFNSGRLVGIMGLSGSGKTTLVELFNGTLKPTTGTVTINSVNVYDSFNQLEGIIGYVPQNDQLNDQLTVYENLFFTAKLCFANASNGEIKLKVQRLLKNFGLYEIKDLKVGNKIDKIISGGQRKRLNIALELIQNPDILFIDEPTSGLSSKGSMEIMNYLKELTFSGKLIFVVIHQPSSEIFKLFNRILILDNGGYLTFDGKPLDALKYFKSTADQVGKHVEECPTCYTTDPESIFEIIDARVLDESGKQTIERKTSPKIWNERFIQNRINKKNDIIDLVPLEPKIKKPSKIKQFETFFIRDAIAKVKNKQFMVVMLLQAPIIGFLLAAFLKEYTGELEEGYNFFTNTNIPSYLFVSVLVAIFFGTTMSAEEIFKDLKILKRQRYLHLSWNSYLLAKITTLVIISGVQSLLYALISAYTIGLMHSFLPYWFVLFSLSVWANMLGLSISTLFKSTKVIYITVPIIIIPQIIFSGLIVRYDRMHPWIKSNNEVPWIGNLMASRWAFEALAVDLTTNNPLEKKFYEAKFHRSQANWKSEFWLPQMHLLLQEKDSLSQQIVKNEIVEENKKWTKLICTTCIESDQINEKETLLHLKKLQTAYNKVYIHWTQKLDELRNGIPTSDLKKLNQQYNNEELIYTVTNKYNLEKVKVDKEKKRIIQLSDPIYQQHTTRILDAPQYVKTKKIFNLQLDTYWVNMLIVWLFSILLYLILAFKLPLIFGKLIQSYLKIREIKRVSTHRKAEVK